MTLNTFHFFPIQGFSCIDTTKICNPTFAAELEVIWQAINFIYYHSLHDPYRLCTTPAWYNPSNTCNPSTSSKFDGVERFILFSLQPSLLFFWFWFDVDSVNVFSDRLEPICDPAMRNWRSTEMGRGCLRKGGLPVSKQWTLSCF